MAIIIDPDNLVDGTEIAVTTGTKKITLSIAGNLSSDGVSLKCVYSKLKELWKSSSTYIRHPFPMVPITDEQFELVNGWDFFDDDTRKLVRTGGWALYDSSGVLQSKYAGIVTLGSIGGTQTPGSGSHQVYFQQGLTGSGATATNVARVGPVNQAIKIEDSRFAVASVNTTSETITATGHTFIDGDTVRYSAGSVLIGGLTNNAIYYVVGVAANTFQVSLTAGGAAINLTATGTGGAFYRTYSSFMKLFVREQSYSYGSASLTDIGVDEMTYQVYRFPLSNASDLKITHTDVQIDANSDNVADVAPYDNMSVSWYDTGQSRTIGGASYTFKVIVDADTAQAGTTSGVARLPQIYEFVQFMLRRSADINANAGTADRVGKTTRELLRFVGDTLYTIYDAVDGGVFIDNFNSADTNSIVFYDDTNTSRTFPYTASGDINFNSYLVTDGTDAGKGIYKMFFENIFSGEFNTDNAVVVKQANGTDDVAGAVTASTVSFDFDYDGNTQAAWAPATTYAINDEFRHSTTWYKVHTGYTSGGTWGATDTTNANAIPGPTVKIVAIGLPTAQYVSASGTIARSIANSYSLVSALERNYSNT